MGAMSHLLMGSALIGDGREPPDNRVTTAVELKLLHERLRLRRFPAVEQGLLWIPG